MKRMAHSLSKIALKTVDKLISVLKNISRIFESCSENFTIESVDDVFYQNNILFLQVNFSSMAFISK